MPGNDAARKVETRVHHRQRPGGGGEVADARNQSLCCAVRSLGPRRRLPVYMPSLFGDAGAPITKSIKTFRTIAGTCVAGQFHVLRSHSSRPIADWLRELAKQAHREAGGRGVVAIGMCFTG